MEVFFATRNSSGYCDWPQNNAKKRGAVKDKLFPAFISRRITAQRSEAQRGAACSVAPAMINSTVYIFLTCSAAQRNVARCGVRWGRTFRRMR